METYTAQADGVRKQAEEEIKFPENYPPFTRCYGLLMEQQDLINQAQAMESKERTFRSQFQEIATSNPQFKRTKTKSEGTTPLANNSVVN